MVIAGSALHPVRRPRRLTVGGDARPVPKREQYTERGLGEGCVLTPERGVEPAATRPAGGFRRLDLSLRADSHNANALPALLALVLITWESAQDGKRAGPTAPARLKTLPRQAGTERKESL